MTIAIGRVLFFKKALTFWDYNKVRSLMTVFDECGYSAVSHRLKIYDAPRFFMKFIFDNQ
jgi:hypothetical protein